MTTPALPAPRILIVDDHALAREGLRAVLVAGGLDVVGAAADGESAVELARELVPDVVLMDVRLGPGIDGLEATRRIVALGQPTRILMLTLHDMSGYVREALAAGAAGYVLKDTAIDDLRAAIAQVMSGQPAFPLELVSAALLEPRQSAGDVQMIAALTARERGVLDCIVQGMTNKQIARTLEISPATVKAHVERIIGKLGVADRTQAAVLAARELSGEAG